MSKEEKPKQQTYAIYGKAYEASKGIHTVGGESTAKIGHTRFIPSTSVGGTIPSDYWWGCLSEFEELANRFDEFGGYDGAVLKLEKQRELQDKISDLTPQERNELANLNRDLRGLDYEDKINYRRLRYIVEIQIRLIANTTPRMSNIMNRIIDGSYQGVTTLAITPKAGSQSRYGELPVDDEEAEESSGAPKKYHDAIEAVP